MSSAMTGIVGAPPITTFGLTNDSAPTVPQGTIITAQDPYWGGGEFIYARAESTISSLALCELAPTFNSSDGKYRWKCAEVANAPNLGRSLVIAIGPVTNGNYGWFMMAGLTPVDSTASVAAGTSIGIAAAGQAGAVANGKQLLNTRVVVAATATVAKTGVAASGSTQLQVSGSDGWFIGVFLSGTGIAAGTTVSAISPDGRTVTLSVATTALVNGTVTGTYNDATTFYNVVYINRPFAQGQIA